MFGLEGDARIEHLRAQKNILNARIKEMQDEARAAKTVKKGRGTLQRPAAKPPKKKAGGNVARETRAAKADAKGRRRGGLGDKGLSSASPAQSAGDARRGAKRKTAEANAGGGATASRLDATPVELKVQPRFFEAFLREEKTFEGRLCSQKLERGLRPGSRVNILNTSGDALKMKVLSVKKFDTFESALQGRHTSFIPWAENLEEAVKVYQGFPFYKSQEAKTGVLAIKLKKA